ncbi:MAG: hypothetical protein FGM33_02260 [Candidatus Kapabacteria bacterium]|nr:hypothetical protein [Candidatus Kapabacteria bacterium]
MKTLLTTLHVLILVLTPLLTSKGQILPPVTIRTSVNPAPGALYIAPNSRVNNPPFSPSLMVVGNDGKTISSRILKEYAFDFRVNPDGRLGYSIFQSAGSGPRESSSIYLVDTTLATYDSLMPANPYNLAMHGFMVLPNGNRVIILQENVTVDMRPMVTGGHPAASVQQMLLQEIDITGRIVFQWRSLDHFPVTVSYENLTAPSIRYFHLNAVEIDRDGHFLISARHASLVAKIHRTTGEVLWILGGKLNQFTFENGLGNNEPAEFSYQHDIRRLSNGNISLFDNGSQRTPQWSRGVEYQLDEQKKTCRLVWQYRNTPDLYAGVQGSMQTLPNGNRLIAWGSALSNNRTLISEVNSKGEIMLEAELPNMMFPYKAEKFLAPTGRDAADVLIDEILPTNTYTYTRGQDTVGVTITYHTLISFFYNTTTARRFMWSPESPRFVSGKGSSAVAVSAPRTIYQSRMTITQEGMESHGAEFRFNVDRFNIADPNNTTVYYRETIGKGAFMPLRTRYNPNTRELVVDTAQVGEFCFGSPLSIETNLTVPRQLSPIDGIKVSSLDPPTLRVSPQGVHTSLRYILKNATGQTLLDTVVSADRFTTATPLPPGTYTWNIQAIQRTPAGVEIVRSQLSGEETFEVATPFITLTGLDTAQTWSQDLSYPVTWKTNLTGRVKIELVNASGVVATISDSAQAPLSGLLWRVPVSVPQGTGYGIRITSLQPGVLVTEESLRLITIDQGSSVQSLVNDRITIGPNPATTSVLVGGDVVMSQILLFDNSGALRKSIDVQGTGGRADVSDLLPGLYHVIIQTHNGPVAKQVLVTR